MASMLAAYAREFDSSEPLSGLEIGERPLPEVPEGWTTVEVRAASLNHHDVWSLRGVGLKQEQLPMILGTDAAGVDADGRNVIVYPVIGDRDWDGDNTLDPSRSLLSERYQGTFAEQVVVPRENLVEMPEQLTFEEAACLPTAWLTAYRMLFGQGRLTPGQRVLVQGATGGVATALISLGRTCGLEVWATGRTEEKREFATGLGAHRTFEPGERLPDRVDAVMEVVGEDTWAHSLRALKPGGCIVVSGATSGANPPADLQRVFFRSLQVIGSTMGTRTELEHLLNLCVSAGVRPVIDRVVPLQDAAEAIRAMVERTMSGKIVLTP